MSAAETTITREEALADFRWATLSRVLDQTQEQLAKQQVAGFFIGCRGQEVARSVASALVQRGDWMRGYYRCLPEVLRTGVMNVRQTIAQILGNSNPGEDPASGGRQMNNHPSSPLIGADGGLIDLNAQPNYGSDVSSVGSQAAVALGFALTERILAQNPEIAGQFPRISDGTPHITHWNLGDGACSEGIVSESMNQTVIWDAPQIVSIYDNGRGITVPTLKQVAGGNPATIFKGLETDATLKIIGPVESWNYAALKKAYKEAEEHVKQTGHPVVVHVKVTRPNGHSVSGDPRLTESTDQLAWEEAHDPLKHLRAWLIENKFASEGELDAVVAEAKSLVDNELKEALKDYVRPSEIMVNNALNLFRKIQEIPAVCAYHDAVAAIQKQIDAFSIQSTDPLLILKEKAGAFKLSKLFLAVRTVLSLTRHCKGEESWDVLLELYHTIEKEAHERFSTHAYAPHEKSARSAPFIEPRYSDSSIHDTNAHIISAGFACRMKADPRVIITGQDEAKLGGVSHCTLGLVGGREQVIARKGNPDAWENNGALSRHLPPEGFGEGRIFDWGIAEATIAGTVIGMAMRGLKPIGACQYVDYIVYMLQQLIDEAGSLRYRTDGTQECPCIIRTHGHRLQGMWHAGSPMGMLLGVPGIFVAVPRDGVQAVGLYNAALKYGRDPTVIVEPLIKLKQKIRVPDNLEEVCIPFGHSEVLREGRDVTIVTYGPCCDLAKAAAEELEKTGVSVEVVDLQTLNPLDLNGVAADSIRKTGKVVFLDEDYARGAMDMISAELIHKRRDTAGNPNLWHIECHKILTGPDHKPPYAEEGLFFTKPQVYSIVDGVNSMLDELDGGTRNIFRT